MPKVNLKKDYKDGQVLHGRELNLDNELTEKAINDNSVLQDINTEKLETIERGAQVNTVETVNGVVPGNDKNILLTKSDIGLDKVDNVADINKTTSEPQKVYIASEITKSIAIKLEKNNIIAGQNVNVIEDENSNNVLIEVPSIDTTLSIVNTNTSRSLKIFIGTQQEWANYIDEHPEIDLNEYLIGIIEGE